MDRSELLDPFNRLLEDASSLAVVRRIEAGEPIRALWGELEASGFLDALVPEADGGAGLSLGDIEPLLQSLGRHAVPAPVGETMTARALLARAGLQAPTGPIVLVTLERGRSPVIPLAKVAEWALIDGVGGLVLASVRNAATQEVGAANSLAASLSWSATPEGPTLAAPTEGLRPVAAVLRAAAIAGAADRLLEMTVDYANARVQFGKPIGRQQAIQQQLAVMAEQVVAARIAAQIGCASGLPPTVSAAAVAKQTTSAVAAQVANTAHAVHGAIGISAEYDLQLFTRRLHEWRLADGSESYWAERLGTLWLDGSAASSLDFVRAIA